MIYSNSYQLATQAKSANQASLEPKLSFPWLDIGLQELSCRAAVHGKSAETLGLFSAQLRGWRLSYLSYPVLFPNWEDSPMSTNRNRARPCTHYVKANTVLSVVIPHHSGVLTLPQPCQHLMNFYSVKHTLSRPSDLTLVSDKILYLNETFYENSKYKINKNNSAEMDLKTLQPISCRLFLTTFWQLLEFLRT